MLLEVKQIGYVYTLSCPETGLVRYIGQTINPSKRYNLHIYHSKNCRALTHKEKWINSLLSKGLKPVIDIIWDGEATMLDQKETEFIALYKSVGANLTNATLGGLTTRGRICSEETKRKLSVMMKGKCLRPPITEAEKQALSNRRKGVPISRESIEKMRLTKKGQPGTWSTTPMPAEVWEKFHAAALALSKPVIAIKDGIENEYPSIKEAARSTGTDKTSIKRYLSGKRKSVKGYIFKYSES